MRGHLVLALFGCALLCGCGGGGGGGNSSPSSASTPAPITTNVLPISVNPGPAGTVNLPFASVTVCTPGSTTACQTIDGVLIDTGSSGLRIVASVLSTVVLPQQTNANGSSIAECALFADGFSWGSVRTADVKIAGEQAGSLPVHLIGDPAFPTIPASCSGTGRSRNTVKSLGANGILGVGSFIQDCGSQCVQNSSLGIYYACPTAIPCQSTTQPLAGQVTNPVARFSSDNNGMIVQLPAVPQNGAATADGSLIFGLGTQANNGLGSATVFAIDPNTGWFTTLYRGSTMPRSFIDSGSNALFFFDSSITACSSASTPGFYCPSSTQALSATVQGTNGANAVINFSVANASSLLAGGFAAFNNLGSPVSSSKSFDWGLPFFFGRNVFVAIEGASVPGAPAGPFIAF